MVNQLLNAVTKQLGTTFGTGYHYYVEDIEQGFEKPAFHARVRIPTQRSKSAILYDRTMPIVIHYFTDSKTDVMKQCYDMGEQIVECLEYLPFMGTTLRAEDVSYHVTDGVLQVFLTYEFTTRKVTEELDKMESSIGTIAHSN